MIIPHAPRASKTATPLQAQLKSWQRKKTRRRWITIATAIALGSLAVFCFNSWRGATPPRAALGRLAQQVLQWMDQMTKKKTAPLASPAPTPETSPAPTSEPAPISPAPLPEPEAIGWLLSHPDQWPKQLKLSTETEFPVVAGEKTVGRFKVPVGRTVEVLELTSTDLLVAFREGERRVRHSDTDLSAVAKNIMAKPASPNPHVMPNAAPDANPEPVSAPASPQENLGALIHRDKSGNIISVVFRVWAPHAKCVDVVGSFNRWKPGADKMVKAEYTGIWTKELPSARPGDEYMFLVNGEKERRDPRARQIAPGGKCVVYDSLRFDWGQTAAWKSPGLLEDLVIYQLHPGTFYDPDPSDGEPGTLFDAAGKLDHLRDLGVNCILLMPINEFSGKYSWGYNPSDLFAVERAYGGADALKTFVKEAHARGIAVHLDVVHNHYGPGELDLWQFDGYGGGESKAGIYFYEDGQKATTPWGPRPDFGRREVIDFIADQIRMWFDEYKIDGLRWDSTVNIRRYNEGADENPEGEGLLKSLSHMIRREYPGKLSIAEDSLGDERFDSSWEYDFHHAGADRESGVVPELTRTDGKPDAEDLANHIQSPLGLRRVIYTENHDETGRLNGHKRLISEADPTDPQSLSARRKSALGAVLTLTSPGVPLIFMGQEILEDREFHDSNPLDWQRGARAAQTFQLWHDLVRLRRNLDGRGAALTGTRIRVLEADRGKGLLVYRRYLPGQPDVDLVVVLNLFSEAMESRPVWFPRAGKWKALIDTDDRRYGGESGGALPQEFCTDKSQKITLKAAPYSAQIFTLSEASSPPGAVEETSRAAEELADAPPGPSQEPISVEESPRSGEERPAPAQQATEDGGADR